MNQLFIIKIGGNIIDDESKLASFLKDFASISGNKILVHGGGKLATKVAEGMNIQQQMVDGRRITDAETLKVVTMVYAGAINKNIVAQLQANGCNAIGLSGADANLIKANKRPLVNNIDYGFVGDVVSINTPFIQILLQQNITPVIAPITHNTQGNLLNTNADTIAQELAQALSCLYKTSLIYSFEKEGVLENMEDDNSVIKEINTTLYTALKKDKKIHSGMIPKLDNAFTAIEKGVNKVVIGNAEKINALINGTNGTQIVK